MEASTTLRTIGAPILLTGATGYVGGRLRKALELPGERLRCLARHPEHLDGRVAPDTEVVRGDVLAPESLEPALGGVEAAYYLVHSMGASGDFEEADRTGARNFAAAARRAGVRRIVYHGGLGDPREELSPHLRSRVRCMRRSARWLRRLGAIQSRGWMCTLACPHWSAGTTPRGVSQIRWRRCETGCAATSAASRA